VLWPFQQAVGECCSTNAAAIAVTDVFYYPTLHTSFTKLEIPHCLFDPAGCEDFRIRAARTRPDGGKLNCPVELLNVRRLAALMFVGSCRELGGSRLYFYPLVVPVGCFIYPLECWDHKLDLSKMVRKDRASASQF